MIPEQCDLPTEAAEAVEQIDQRLDEMERETSRLLEQRSRIIDEYMAGSRNRGQ